MTRRRLFAARSISSSRQPAKPRDNPRRGGVRKNMLSATSRRPGRKCKSDIYDLLISPTIKALGMRKDGQLAARLGSRSTVARGASATRAGVSLCAPNCVCEPVHICCCLGLIMWLELTRKGISMTTVSRITFLSSKARRGADSERSLAKTCSAHPHQEPSRP